MAELFPSIVGSPVERCLESMKLIPVIILNFKQPD
jgi:hypothetical protein